MSDPTTARATGVGSTPGDDQVAFDEALRVVLGELAPPTGLPFVPEVPGRGATAGMTGRALALVTELGVDLQPAGWRLAGAPSASGVDHRRARSLLAQDLDTVEEQTQGYAGGFKVQLAGPWTLAATVEKPRGDKVLADHGARRDLAAALAEGVRDHVADLRRRLPGADPLVVQVDEPALAAVLGARVPTASGFGKHRAVEPAEASDLLALVLTAVTDAGAEPWVHSCAGDTPWALVRGAGAQGLLADPAVVDGTGHDALAGALEAGLVVGLGVLPSTDPSSAPTDAQVTERVLRWLDMLGLDPAEIGDRLLVTPSCGLAGATPAWSRRALELAAAAARNLA